MSVAGLSLSLRRAGRRGPCKPCQWLTQVYQCIYSASKAAQQHYREALRLELRPSPRFHLSEGSFFKAAEREIKHQEAGENFATGMRVAAFAENVLDDVLSGATGRVSAGRVRPLSGFSRAASHSLYRILFVLVPYIIPHKEAHNLAVLACTKKRLDKALAACHNQGKLHTALVLDADRTLGVTSALPTFVCTFRSRIMKRRGLRSDDKNLIRFWKLT
ncbi:hypothetical protein VTI74DRAFT_3480 [Chaetomium olivicolor]